MLFPKRPPPRVLEPADVPVATAVVLPVALEFPAPGNKLPPLPLMPVEAPVEKGLAPEAAGFGKPNGDPELEKLLLMVWVRECVADSTRAPTPL